MADSSFILPTLALIAVLCGMRARIDVYDAFVRGARSGLMTLLGMTPYLCAVLTAVSLMRETGVMEAVERMAAPLLSLAGLPRETAGVVMLRPLSGSAALGAARELMAEMGPESRAAKIACVVSAASETIFFTGSLYMGAGGVKRARYAMPAAWIAYAVGVLTAGLVIT
ncbi:MAG: spore maturation protein [Clostridia bacterium]|nr:spore maturation protein [Clostridia bacterium]